jgi:hypothetical protein
LSLTFLAPLGALIGLAVLFPVVGAWARERRDVRVRGVLGVASPPRRAAAPVLVAWVAAFGLLAAAAAQPVLRTTSTIEQRTDAQAFVVVDITRSMLAARGPDAPKRIERATDAAIEIRRLLPDVPFGAASVTNRPLAHLFPTPDADEFELVMRQAIGVNRPPGTLKVEFAVSTDLYALAAVGTENFFAADSTRRLVFLLTDGESNPFAARRLVEELQKGGVELVTVRFWNADERIWQPDGTPEPGYRPVGIALEYLDDLAALTLGGRVFTEDEVGAAVTVARRYLGDGPVVSVPAPGRTVSLAPYAVLAACIPLAALLLAGLRLPAGARARGLQALPTRSWKSGTRRLVAGRRRSELPATRHEEARL